MNKKTKLKAAATISALMASAIILGGCGSNAKNTDIMEISQTVEAADSKTIFSNSGERVEANSKNIISKDKKVEAFTSINADMDILDLKIRRSNDKYFHISYTVKIKKGISLKNEPISYQISDGVLTLTDTIKSNQLAHKATKTLVELYIQQNSELSDSTIKLSDGDMTVSNTALQSGSIDMEEGDLSLKGANLSNMKIKLEDGDVMTNKASVKDISFNIEDGDFTASKLTAANTVNITSDTGDITFKDASSSLTTASITAKTVDGDVVLSKAMKKTMKKTGNGTYQNEISNPTSTLGIETEEGDISLK